MDKKTEHRFYSRLGKIVLLSLIMLASYIIYFFFNSSEYSSYISVCQEYSARGIDVKENNKDFKRFLFNIKRNNGVLVLGSSETGAFGRENYHGLLNEYYNCGHDFSVLGGAGRTGHIFYPTFLNNKELFKGMNVLYFVNPTYWRESLNYFQAEYYNRYNSIKNVIKVKSELCDFDLYSDYGGQNIDFIDYSFLLEEIRIPFYELNTKLKGDVGENIGPCARIKTSKIDSNRIKGLLDDLVLEKNISVDYDSKDNEKFVKIKTSDFQINALKGFNDISVNLGINITYVLGPYNGVYCELYSPEYCESHEEVLSKIRAFFNEEKASYIDCGDLSYVPGTFIDVQHHSKYAAWIIADRINEYYEKNN